jgi:hypothetical protein
MGNMVARDEVEPPTPAFSELVFAVFLTTSRLLRDCQTLENTNKADQPLVIAVGDLGKGKIPAGDLGTGRSSGRPIVS